MTLSRPMGKKRGKTEGSFVRETRTQTFSFYRDLVQDLKAWQARAPKLREEPPPNPQDDAPRPDPPPAGAVENREPGEAEDPLAKLGSQASGAAAVVWQDTHDDLPQSGRSNGVEVDKLRT